MAQISTNTGIAIQDYITADSAYVIVCPASDKPTATEAADASELDPSYLLSKVFDINGRCCTPSPSAAPAGRERHESGGGGGGGGGGY